MACIDQSQQLHRQIQQHQNVQSFQKSLAAHRLSISLHNSFQFRSHHEDLAQIVRALSQQDIDQIKTCSITLMGDQIKPGNVSCLASTIIFGLMCIFPFFFCCCHWWKRAVSQVFKISQQSYIQIGTVISGRNIQVLNLCLYDNFINHRKLFTLMKYISKTKIKELNIINEAGAFDMSNKQYSNFLIHAKPLTHLRLKSYDIRWFRQVISKQCGK